MDKFESLRQQALKFGFEVVDQTWTDGAGKVHPVVLNPVDPEALVYAAAKVYTDRNYVRAQRVKAKL
jgi:hypothetical protein